MPELPEVETTRRGIAPHIEGQRIHAVHARVAKLRQTLDSAALDRLAGCVINHVARRGKHLILHSDDPHRGLHDPRRFGHVAVIDPLQPPPALATLGVEPLDEAFNEARLYAQTRGKTAAIKTHIMDQRHVVGVGNIYATEALYASGIHPARRATSLDEAECATLAAAIKHVLQEAIAQGGTTLRDFSQPDGTSGYFAVKLAVYGKNGEPCPRCGTPLAHVTIGGRSSVYCPKCQPLL